MRVIGIMLVLLGILALAVPSITFMTTERAVDTGFLQIDYQKPHTIVLNPIVGVVAAVAGIAMIFAGRRTGTV
ncbi:hypothetical protein VT84_06125 [Gemmata sp. SH-PL17]|uniref:DUF3185 domain-containing protein n=1 Tax=Gemmata massiliana TaxID=1210884 RepID=A0A6P2CSN5_9BACT|nr:MULTISPECIES: hypothetical protein [Gemmata]AMV23952.1 hypothetical protein VT84_06125 [Gemmata sp. SH-PL17]VTR92108.1 Uncharacterized protein OS=Desulfomicrobium baculatum (strain DSM 4028 / VKM B-1378) GN=Dbac_2186 PE=4 SV=1 [Gemmata massiliana]